MVLFAEPLRPAEVIVIVNQVVIKRSKCIDIFFYGKEAVPVTGVIEAKGKASTASEEIDVCEFCLLFHKGHRISWERSYRLLGRLQSL